MINPHSRILMNFRSLRRRPIYSVLNCLGSVVALISAVHTFHYSTQIMPTRGYIPSTSSDTAVSVVPTDIPLLPTPNQEVEPGKTLTKEQSLQSVKSFVIESLKECFTMNYLNYSNVLSKCKYRYLDSESSTSDDFFSMLQTSNFLALLKKYQTASTTFIDKDSLKLINQGIASIPLGNGTIRRRYVWIFELNMHYSMQKIDITSPKTWQVEIIRESTLNKELPISVFKLRDIG